MSSSIPSWQISTAHAQPFRGARDLAFCLKVPLDLLLIWASSEGSGETARMRRLAWTFAARIGYKYQIRLTRSIYIKSMMESECSMSQSKPEDSRLEEFKQNILQKADENSLVDSFSTVAPDTSISCTEYDDQFEGVFYRTLKEESQITINFESKVHYNSFHSKFLADFASSITTYQSDCIY